ncbi:MAG: hypothetical protein MUC61_03900 [Amoebophilaceae bacterium]|jgi:hypothetical protein|nr:hypothetical protein [Amoebophilaceae bacterium]
MRNIRRVLISLLLIAGLTNCGSQSVESRKNELMVKKEVLIRSLASQVAWLVKAKKYSDVTPHQANTYAKLVLSGLCGILERKELEGSDIGARAYCFFSEISEEWGIDSDFLRISLSLPFDKLDAKGAVVLLLELFLSEKASEIEKRETKKMCEAIVNSAKDLFEVMEQIRELS